MDKFQAMAKTYLRVAHAARLLKALPEQRKDMFSPDRWFELHPAHRFLPPSAEREGSGFCLHYHRQDARGMLVVGELAADAEGRILRHEERDCMRLQKSRVPSEPRGLCGRAPGKAWPDGSWVLKPASPVKPLFARVDNAALKLQWEKLPKGRLDKAIRLWIEGGPTEAGGSKKGRHDLSPLDEDFDDPPFFKVINWEDLDLPKYAKRSTLVVRIAKQVRNESLIHWVVVQPQKRRAAWFRNCGELNQVLRLMKTRAPRHDEEAKSWALLYNSRVLDVDASDLRHVLYEPRDVETPLSPRSWFEQHPEHPFYKPRVVRVQGRWVVSFYSWQLAGTGLFRHTITMKKNGQLVSFLLEKLSDKVQGPPIR